MNDNFSMKQVMTAAAPFSNVEETAVLSGDRVGAIGNLPPTDTKRWVVRRKATVVHAVRDGVISLQEACRRYRLSVEEFLAWQRAIERYGIAGLRTTRLQIYRNTQDARSAK